MQGVQETQQLLEQTSVCPDSGAARTWVLVSSGLQASQSPSVSPSNPPMSRVGSSLPSGVGHQNCDAQSPFFSEFPPRGIGPYLFSILPFLLDLSYILGCTGVLLPLS